MKYDFSDAFRKAVEPVGTEAFRLIAKILIDGPPQGLIWADIWCDSDTSRAASDTEALQAGYLADVIENCSSMPAFMRNLIGLAGSSSQWP